MKVYWIQTQIKDGLDISKLPNDLKETVELIKTASSDFKSESEEARQMDDLIQQDKDDIKAIADAMPKKDVPTPPKEETKKEEKSDKKEQKPPSNTSNFISIEAKASVEKMIEALQKKNYRVIKKTPSSIASKVNHTPEYKAEVKQNNTINRVVNRITSQAKKADIPEKDKVKIEKTVKGIGDAFFVLLMELEELAAAGRHEDLEVIHNGFKTIVKESTKNDAPNKYGKTKALKKAVDNILK